MSFSSHSGVIKESYRSHSKLIQESFQKSFKSQESFTWMLPALHLNPPFPWAEGRGETKARKVRTKTGISMLDILSGIGISIFLAINWISNITTWYHFDTNILHFPNIVLSSKINYARFSFVAGIWVV